MEAAATAAEPAGLTSLRQRRVQALQRLAEIRDNKPAAPRGSASVSPGASSAAWGPQEWLALALVSVLAVSTRFYNLGQPDGAVYDETHLGRFVNGYRCPALIDD